MSKAQYRDYRSSLVAAVEQVYPMISTNSAYSLFLPWDNLDLHFIFDVDMSDLTQVIQMRAVELLQRTVMINSKFFNLSNTRFDSLFSLSNTDTRTVQVASSSAQEDQPMNSDVEDITSPTAKQVGSSSGTDTNTSENINDQIKLSKYLSEMKSFGTSIRTALSPIIEEFNEMY